MWIWWASASTLLGTRVMVGEKKGRLRMPGPAARIREGPLTSKLVRSSSKRLKLFMAVDREKKVSHYPNGCVQKEKVTLPTRLQEPQFFCQAED
eukprot:1148206-Pelagomonas_calceolata.AAC.2